MNNIFYNILLLIILIFQWCLVLYGRSIALRLFSNRVLINFVFYIIFIKILIHYTIPAILRINSDFQFEKVDDVKVVDILIIYFIEFFSWFFWLIGLFIANLIYKKNNLKIEKTDFINMNIDESKFLFFIISIGFVINMYYLVSLRPMNVLFSIFSQLFFFTGISIGPLLILASKKIFKNKLFLLLGIFVFVSSIFGIATRGALVYTVFYFLFIFFYLFYSNKNLKYLLIGTIFLILINVTLPDLFGGRVSINENGITIVPQDFSEKQGSRTFLDEVEWRLGAPTRAGTQFLYLYNENPAGINPIRNSLMGFMPRSLNENKPHPSALNANDQYSLGMYLIMGRLYGTETLMVEFPTGAHFYWEFGILGIIILSIISGLYIGLCIRFLTYKGLIAIPLIFATFKPFGYVDPKIWVSDIVMQLYQLILPLIFLLAFIKMWNFIKTIFRIHKFQHEN